MELAGKIGRHDYRHRISDILEYRILGIWSRVTMLHAHGDQPLLEIEGA